MARKSAHEKFPSASPLIGPKAPAAKENFNKRLVLDRPSGMRDLWQTYRLPHLGCTFACRLRGEKEKKKKSSQQTVERQKFVVWEVFLATNPTLLFFSFPSSPYPSPPSLSSFTQV
jgi:hypothetical protein